MGQKSMDNVYPSMDELLSQEKLIVDENIISALRERYEKHGGEYLTPNIHEDGRQINACMFNDSAKDAAEEIVDAIFNIMVMQFKGVPDAYAVVGRLCNTYQWIKRYENWKPGDDV